MQWILQLNHRVFIVTINLLLSLESPINILLHTTFCKQIIGFQFIFNNCCCCTWSCVFIIKDNVLYIYSFYILRVKESMKGNYTTVLTHLDGYFIDFCLVKLYKRNYIHMSNRRKRIIKFRI